MPTNVITPPGAPGIPPRWTSSAKSGVGTAPGRGSRVWFTISHGILNEIYAPRLDTACIRDVGFIITAKDYFSEEKRDADHTIRAVEDGIPAFRLVNTARDGRYRISKTILSDPDREVILRRLHLKRCRVRPVIMLCTPSSLRIWSTLAPITQRGMGTIKDTACCSPRAEAGRWLLPPRSHGSRARPAMLVSLTDGRPYLGAKDCVRSTFAPTTAMLQSQERLIWRRRAGARFWLSALERNRRKRPSVHSSVCSRAWSRRCGATASAGAIGRTACCPSTNRARKERSTGIASAPSSWQRTGMQNWARLSLACRSLGGLPRATMI